MNYAEANEKLTGRCRERRKLENNTYLERRDFDSVAVRLHSTDVLTFFKDGSIQISTGGWNTITTVDRINRYLSRALRVGRHRGLTILYRMKPTAWIPVCTVDNSATISPRGEATGHVHKLDAETAELFEAYNGVYVRVGSEGVSIVHEEHAPVALPANTTYKVHRAREYDYLAAVARTPPGH